MGPEREWEQERQDVDLNQGRKEVFCFLFVCFVLFWIWIFCLFFEKFQCGNHLELDPWKDIVVNSETVFPASCLFGLTWTQDYDLSECSSEPYRGDITECSGEQNMGEGWEAVILDTQPPKRKSKARAQWTEVAPGDLIEALFWACNMRTWHSTPYTSECAQTLAQVQDSGMLWISVSAVHIKSSPLTKAHWFDYRNQRLLTCSRCLSSACRAVNGTIRLLCFR